MHLKPAILLAVVALLAPSRALPDRTREVEVSKWEDALDGYEGMFGEEVEKAAFQNARDSLRRAKEQIPTGFRQSDVDTVEVGDIENKNGFLDWLYNIIGITTTTPKPDLKPPENCAPCSCGQTNKKNRIVGGQETEVKEYPWMALLLYNKQFYCGGSLINNYYVLTAAHCVSGFKMEKMAVRLLEHDRGSPDETETIERKIKRIIRHPRYSNQNYNNDIALLQMDQPVELKGDLRPVCMPQKGKSFKGYEGIVTGWGATEEGGSVSSTLQEVMVPIMSNEECRKTAYGEKRITDNMLCAGYPEGQKDSCQGDSGGGLLVSNDTTTIHSVVGIVSWGEGCAQPDHPGVYTRVNRYLTWLKENTPDACYC